MLNQINDNNSFSIITHSNSSSDAKMYQNWRPSWYNAHKMICKLLTVKQGCLFSFKLKVQLEIREQKAYSDKVGVGIKDLGNEHNLNPSEAGFNIDKIDILMAEKWEQVESLWQFCPPVDNNKRCLLSRFSSRIQWYYRDWGSAMNNQRRW